MKSAPLSILYFLIGLFLLVAGVLLCLLPSQVLVRLLDGKGSLAIGGLTFALGCSCLALLYYSLRKRYMQISLSCGTAVIHHGIIEDYVRHYFAELFPDGELDLDIGIQGDGKMEIFTHLPLLDEKEEMIARIENELGVLLARRLGYEREVLLTLIER